MIQSIHLILKQRGFLAGDLFFCRQIMSTMYDYGFRQAALRVCQQTQTLREASALLGVSISSLSRWQRHPHPRHWTTHPRIATDDLVQLVRVIMDQGHCFSCTDVRHCLLHEHGVMLSRQLVHLILSRRLGLSYKRTRKRSTRHQSHAPMMRHQLLHILELYRSRRIVAVDESGFDHRCVPVYAYAPKGRQAVLRFHPNTTDRRRITLVMGIDSLHGETHTMLSETSVTAASFSDFVLSLPFPPRTVLLMDNAAIHKTACVRRAVEQKEYELCSHHHTPPRSIPSRWCSE